MNEKMQFIKIRSRVLSESTQTIALFCACCRNAMSYEIGNLCIIRTNYAKCNEKKNIDWNLKSLAIVRFAISVGGVCCIGFEFSVIHQGKVFGWSTAWMAFRAMR